MTDYVAARIIKEAGGHPDCVKALGASLSPSVQRPR
jgi:hypothetical protein